MHPIKCLLAVEAESVDVIKTNLEKVYKNEIIFYTCSHGKELSNWGNLDIDILILSRFLPRGEKKEKEFLMHLGLIFPTAHIILLAGSESEQRRVFLELAVQCGITDYVTGKLPGDRPHTIFEAINEAKEWILERRGQPRESLTWEGEQLNQLVQEQQLSKREIQFEKKAAENVISINSWAGQQVPAPAAMPFQWQSVQNQQEPQLTLPPPQQIQPQHPQEQPQINFADLGFTMVDNNPQLITPTQPPQPPQFGGSPFMARQQNGILVVPAANKGGVGKTTAGISLAVLLAKMGVPTVMTDLNFGGPNVAAFFDVKDVPGIEVLTHRNIRPNTVSDLLVEVRPNLHILPGPMDKTIPLFEAEQLAAVVQVLQQMFAVVICDTPPEFWTKPWLAPIFSMADYVLAVVDQSKFSQEETRNFAPYMLAMGAKPENIKIVLNKFDPKLHNPRIVEKAFCAGFKKNVKPLPQVSVVIPNDWVAHVKKSYKGEVAGVDDEKYSQWHKLANEIIKKAGISARPVEEKKRGLLGGLFKKKK